MINSVSAASTGSVAAAAYRTRDVPGRPRASHAATLAVAAKPTIPAAASHPAAVRPSMSTRSSHRSAPSHPTEPTAPATRPRALDRQITATPANATRMAMCRISRGQYVLLLARLR